MTGRWHVINLIGVVVLATLCVFQWQRDRRLNLEINRLERIRIENQQRITEQEQQIRGQAEDLVRFKEQFTAVQAELAETSQKLRLAERETLRLAAERDQLRESVTNWAKAAADRDERIKEANDRITELAGQLNESILEFNSLATNYNAVVRELNEVRASPGPTNR